MPFVEAKFLNRTVAFCFLGWVRCFCFLIVDEAEPVDGDVFPLVEEADVGVVAVVTVVAVFIDNFFMDEEDGIAVFVDGDGENIVDVCISSSDCIIKTIATKVDDPSNRTAAKLELITPYQSCN